MSAQTVLTSWLRGRIGKEDPEVGAMSRFFRWIFLCIKRLFTGGRTAGAEPVTEEFATLSSFTLLPGQLKLRVGVVSVRGNYRDHNEDNYYVPGRRLGPARSFSRHRAREWS